MAKTISVCNAQAKSQIDTITIGGTWAQNDTATIKIGGKLVTYTAGASPTTSTVAAGLQALAAASTEATFTESTWTVASAVITSTSIAGLPITIAVSKSSSSGTITLANTQAATGPNHWDNADNWSTGAVPGNGDDVFIEDADHAFLYGLPTSVTPATLTIRRGQVGLPEINAGGYTEYRTKRAATSSPVVQIGDNGNFVPSLVKLSTNAANVTVTVLNSLRRTDEPAVNLLTNHASALVYVNAGQVAIGAGSEETATLDQLRCAANGTVFLGAGVTIDTVISAGRLEQWCDASDLDVLGGESKVMGSAQVGHVDITGGRCMLLSGETISNLEIGPGECDCSQTMKLKTAANAVIKKGGVLRDPYATLTLTNGISLTSDGSILRCE